MTTVDDLPDVWAVSATPRRPGALVTRGDVCHLHRDRDAAERCGAGFDGTPDLIRVAAINRPARRRGTAMSWRRSRRCRPPRLAGAGTRTGAYAPTAPYSRLRFTQIGIGNSGDRSLWVIRCGRLVVDTPRIVVPPPAADGSRGRRRRAPRLCIHTKSWPLGQRSCVLASGQHPRRPARRASGATSWSQGSRSSTTICASGRASGATLSPAAWLVTLW